MLAIILAIGNMAAKAQMRMGVDTLTLDKVNYRITYQAKQVNDTTQIPTSIDKHRCDSTSERR